MDFFVARDASYVDFAPTLENRQALKPTVETNPGLVARELALARAFEAWWQAHGPKIVKLRGLNSTVTIRKDLLTSFQAALAPVGLLADFQVQGIIAGFWEDNKNDFKTVMTRGPLGLIISWRDTIISELEDEDAKKANPLEHKLVRFLMSKFVDGINALEATKSELDSHIKAASTKSDDEEDYDETAEDNAVDENKIKAWKNELGKTKKALKAQHEGFKTKLGRAVDTLDEAQAADLLLTILHHDMNAIVARYTAAQRKAIVAAFENWWDKYRVTLTEIEQERDAAAETLQAFLRELGYV